MPPSPEQKIVFENIPEEFVGLLLAIPSCPELQTSATDSRLFPSPSLDRNEILNNDWKDFVRPDLEKHFLSAQTIVKNDLASLKQENGSWSFSIPIEHFDHWINAINQTRLAIAASHNLSEDDLAHDSLPNDETLAFHISRVHFYGELQYTLIRYLTSLENP